MIPVLGIVLAGIVLNFPPPAKVVEKPPTAEELVARYRTERATAVKAQAAAEVLASADVLIDRAKTAKPAEALKLIRQARWQLPARPLGLPDHVERLIGYLPLRHSDQINGIVVSPDGRRIATASKDGTVRIWNLENGHELAVYRGHALTPDDKVNDTGVFRIPAIAFAPDGKTLASSGGKEIHLWDAITAQRIRTFTGHTLLIRGLGFTTDGKFILSGSDDKTVASWSVATGKEFQRYQRCSSRIEALAVAPQGKLFAVVDGEGFLSVYLIGAPEGKPILKVSVADGGVLPVRAVAFSADGSKIVCGGRDKIARIVVAPPADGSAKAGMGSTLVRLAGHTDTITAAAFSPDGTRVMTGSEDGTLRVWDSTNASVVRTFTAHPGGVTALALTPDGTELISGGIEGKIRLWPLNEFDEHALTPPTKEPLWAVTVSPDGLTFAVAGADRITRIFKTETQQLETTLTGHAGAITGVVYTSPRQLATASGDRLIKLWSLPDGKLMRDLVGHTGPVLALANGGGTLVSGAADKTVKAWNLETGKPEWSWPGESRVTALAVDPTGKRIVVGSADGWMTMLAVGPMATPIARAGQTAHASGVAAVAFSPNGNKLASVGGDGTFKLWTIAADGTLVTVNFSNDPKKATPVAGPNAPALSAIAFDPDGRHVAYAGADKLIHVIDTVTGTEPRTLRGPTDWVTALAYAPDGGRLISAGADKVARVFELAKSSAGRVGHAGLVRSVAVSRDGTRIASASDDRTIKIWDLASGTELTTLSGPTGMTYVVGFLGNNTLYAGGEDGRLRLWSLKPAKEIRVVSYHMIINAMAAADGSKLIVWTRNATGQDSYEFLTADGSSAGDPLVVKDQRATSSTIATDLSQLIAGDDQGVVRFTNLATKAPLGSAWGILDQKRVLDVAMTPNQETILAIDDDGIVKVGTIKTRTVTQTIETKIVGINGIFIAPSGQSFVVLGTDGQVKFFDLSGKLLRAWTMPTPANSAAFTPDTKRLITAQADGTLGVLLLP